MYQQPTTIDATQAGRGGVAPAMVQYQTSSPGMYAYGQYPYQQSGMYAYGGQAAYVDPSGGRGRGAGGRGRGSFGMAGFGINDGGFGRGGMMFGRGMRRKKPFVGGTLETQRQWEQTSLCCFFVQGACKFGEGCRFSHDDDGKRSCQFGANCRMGHQNRGGAPMEQQAPVQVPLQE